MNQQNNLAKGVLFAFVTSVISGFAIFYSKISVAKIDPLVLATARNLYVGIVFLLLITASKKLSSLATLKKKDLVSLVLIGAIGGGIPFYLFFSGLQLIGAQTGNLIHKTLFLWVTLFGIIFLKEKLKVSLIASYLLIVAGTFLFTPFKISFGRGEFLVLTATLLWSAENIIAKKALKRILPDLVGLFRMGIGALILLGLTVINGKQQILMALNTRQLITIVIGATILSFYVFFWYRALRYVPAGLATLLLTFSVVVGNFLNGGFTGVKLTQNDILSSLLIAAGTFIVYVGILSRYVSRFLSRHG